MATRLTIVSIIGGLMTGCLGIGGATVYNPMMIEMGKNPQVASATGMYIVMIGSTVSTLYFVGKGDFHYQYQLFLGALVLVGSLVGTIMANNVVK